MSEPLRVPPPSVRGRARDVVAPPRDPGLCNHPLDQVCQFDGFLVCLVLIALALLGAGALVWHGLGVVLS